MAKDFFDRELELRLLQDRVKDRNHVVLSGQRRMGKTSLLQELGRRLTSEGWLVLFVDVEAASSAEDAIADIAHAAYEHRPLRSHAIEGVRSWFTENLDELDVYNFRLKLRANLDNSSWRRHGDRLFSDCAANEKPVLLVIDELPIFLKRMVRHDGSAKRVDEFLSWLRAATQMLGDGSPVILVSGSIGLAPLVNRLGIPDRINYLDPFRLGAWDCATTIACIETLAQSYGLKVEDGVGRAVYGSLGVGIPHHVQSFFARLRDHSIQHVKDTLTVADVEEVYRSSLLGAPGQNDLVHYESRLKEALDDDGYSIAMEILAEAALEGIFSSDAERALVVQYQDLIEDVPRWISEVLDVLEHDGYLASEKGNY